MATYRSDCIRISWLWIYNTNKPSLLILLQITLPVPAPLLECVFPLFDHHTAVVSCTRPSASASSVIYHFDNDSKLVSTFNIPDATIIRQNISCISSHQLVFYLPTVARFGKIDFKTNTLTQVQSGRSRIKYNQDTRIYVFSKCRTLCLLQEFKTQKSYTAQAVFYDVDTMAMISFHELPMIANYSPYQLDENGRLLLLNHRSPSLVIDALIVTEASITPLNPPIAAKALVRRIFGLHNSTDFLVVCDAETQDKRVFVYNSMTKETRKFGGGDEKIVPQNFFEMYVSGRYLYVFTYGNYSKEEAEKGCPLVLIDLEKERLAGFESRCFTKLGYLYTVSRDGQAKILELTRTSIPAGQHLLQNVSNLKIKIEKPVTRTELMIFMLKNLRLTTDEIETVLCGIDFDR